MIVCLFAADSEAFVLCSLTVGLECTSALLQKWQTKLIHQFHHSIVHSLIKSESFRKSKMTVEEGASKINANSYS